MAVQLPMLCDALRQKDQDWDPELFVRDPSDCVGFSLFLGDFLL